MVTTIQREKDIQKKLDLTAKALYDAKMFKRVIVPLGGEKGNITALGMVGLSKGFPNFAIIFHSRGSGTL